MSIGILTDPRTINQVAPNQRVAKNWDRISQNLAPFGVCDTKTIGFWFNYFWSEAVKKPGLSQAEKVKLSEMYYNVFQDNDTLRPDFATREDFWKESVLRQILLIGFRRVDTQNLASPSKIAPQGKSGLDRLFPSGLPLKASHAKDLNLEIVVSANSTELPIAYRADSRDVDQLKNGFQARARSYASPIYKNYGFDQRWHPFNNPLYQDSVWLRLGATNKDNCLHTVISVGPSFAGITHFPILNDINVFPARSSTPSYNRENQFLAFKAFDEWTPADDQAALANWNKVRAVRKNGQITHLEKTNHVYVFHLNGITGFNTEAYFTGTDKFPERGMSEVPFSHFLADLKFTQSYWYNHEERQIKLYDIKFEPVDWLPNPVAAMQFLGKDGMLRVLNLIQGQIGLAENRSEVLKEAIEFATWKTTKQALTLTGAEKTLIIAQIKSYLDTNKPRFPNGAKEREAVKQALPNLTAKIDATNIETWGKFKKLATT